MTITPQSFVADLEKMVPGLDILKKQGYNDEALTNFIASYTAIPKKTSTKESTFLLQIFDLFDLHTIEIGMLCFNQEIVLKGNYYHFGKFELDELVLDTLSNEVKVMDHDEATFAIWDCAASPETFFTALLICNRYLTARMLDDRLWNDNNVGIETAAIASEIAGGDKYSDFYLMQLGE